MNGIIKEPYVTLCRVYILKWDEITSGNLAALAGGGVLLGEEERPLPNMLGTMMKYLLGSRPMPGPISQSLSQCLPEYQVGYKIALLWSLFNSPQTLYADSTRLEMMRGYKQTLSN